jgi:hypothetical protein
MRPEDFSLDAFISYAHVDNQALVEGHQGWVANLQRALEIRITEFRGEKAHIWRDPELHGDDYLAITLVDKLRCVAALVAIVTPGYIRSEWGRKELTAFCKAAEEHGGLRVGNKARIFKVLKAPVPLEQHPQELQPLLGYEFFKIDPQTKRIHGLDDVFGDEAQRDFWLKLDDLAHDISDLIDVLESKSPLPEKGRVYLAETTRDLDDQREALKRDLVQHGYLVLSDRPLPLAAPELENAVRECLARCCMSIHIIGGTYSLVPEGGVASLQEVQNELAIDRARQDRSFRHLVWLAPKPVIPDERQRTFVERLRRDERCPAGTDLLETPLEDLRTVIHAQLAKLEGPAEKPVFACASAQVYLLYDPGDANVIDPWAKLLSDDFEVIHPSFNGNEAELREYHAENLRCCDGVLIFYGAGHEMWLRGKLREIQKSPGYGRTKGRPIVGVVLMAPRTPEKEHFCTHEAIVLARWDGPAPDALQPFSSRLKSGRSDPVDEAGASA